MNRNHFGRQVESFQASLDLPFLRDTERILNGDISRPFRSVFIRAPVVEKILPHKEGIQIEEAARDATVVAPSKTPIDDIAKEELRKEVEVLAKLPGHATAIPNPELSAHDVGEEGDIIAVRQGNVFGTSFHPELTGDPRIHVWWLKQILDILDRKEED